MELYPWAFVLRGNSTLLADVRQQWATLLDQPNVTERELHKFIREHAGLFFPAIDRIPFVVSEFSLGTDFRVDLVIPRDRASNGFHYTLVELEDCSSDLFKERDPVRRLSGAVRQTMEWRKYLSDHSEFRREFLPDSFGGNSPMYNIDFLIVMGRRDLDQAEWRNEFAQYSGQIEIRSYDSLTEELGRRLTNLFYIQECGATRNITVQQLNQMANPFAQAMRFADWKALCRKWQPPCHAVANQAAEILARRPVNEALFQRYRVLDAEAEKEFGPWSRCGFFGR